MDLRKTAVFAGLNNLIDIRNDGLSSGAEQSFFLSATEFCKAAYKSWNIKMLVNALANSIWCRGRICHGISMPGNGRAFVNGIDGTVKKAESSSVFL